MSVEYRTPDWADKTHPWGLISDLTEVVVVTDAWTNPMRDLAPWWPPRGHRNIVQLHRVDGGWHPVGTCEGCADGDGTVESKAAIR